MYREGRDQKFNPRSIARNFDPDGSDRICSIPQNTIGPKKFTHIFMIWELISQLHRTSVTQGVLAGVLLCKWAPAQGTFCGGANYTH